MSQIVINGNNIDILKTYPDNYFDAVVTDPPYGLGKEPNAAELMKDWVEFGYHEVKGTGFMGKEWDAFVPQPVFWKEVFRVLKHGGHVLSFFGTRTYDWGVMSMRFAGFEVRDCIQWLYGSGFPKSHNIGKAIDKMEGNEREVVGKATSGSTAKAFNLNEQQREAGTGIIAGQYSLTKGQSEWEGWGTALKPANEPIVLARKPLEKGLSVAENILKWGVGGINIDASRIGTNGEKWSVPMWKSGVVNPKTPNFVSERIDVMHETNPQGRFPANIILDEIAAEILDEQSGISKSSNAKRTRNTLGSFGMPNDTTTEYSDKGGASRFFKTFSQDDIHYCYLCGKANKNELWKNNYNNVLNAVSNLKSTSQTKEPIVQENVTESLRKKADQIVKNVANLCDLCVINFVQEVVEINNLDSKKEQLTLMQDFIQDCRKCTLLQNLVCYVEMMDNIDTTPITQTLLKLFGYAWTAIENYINKDIKEAEAQKLGLTRFQYQAKASKSERNKGLQGFETKQTTGGGGTYNEEAGAKYGSIKAEGKNFHPTVKPIKLMQYLVKMITPPNGIVLDPFCGSGTTGIACKLEGYQFVGMEQDAEYSKIAEGRINNYIENHKEYQEDTPETEHSTINDDDKPQLTLF